MSGKGREKFTCPDCGWVWFKGDDGSHDCKSLLLPMIKALRAENKLLHEAIDEINTSIRRVRG